MNKYLLRICVVGCLLAIFGAMVGFAQESDCSSLEARLTIGGMGEVTPGSANNVRQQSSTTAEILFRMEAGSRFQVVDGPQCGEGYTWWQVSFGGQTGWTVEGNADGYFLMPVDTDTTVATETPAPETSSECALEPRLAVGQMARITTATPSRLRDAAGTSGTQIGQIDPLDMLTILAGPVCADGINWWQVRTSSATGWTAEGLDSEYFLELVPMTPTPAPPSVTAYAVDWSADGTYIAIGAKEGLIVYDSTDWSASPQQYLAGSSIASLAFNPQEANQLAVSVSFYDAGFDMDLAKLIILDVETGEVISTLLENVAMITPRDLVFSSDGSRLSGHQRGTFTAYDVTTGESDYQVLPLDYGDGSLEFRGFSHTTFSPDGAWIAGAYPGGQASIVFVGAYGASAAELIGIETVSIPEVITSLAFSPESDRFVTGGVNGNLRMWAVSDFDYHSFIRGERSTTSNRVNALAFSPAKPVLASAESDPFGVVRLFDATTLQQIGAAVLPNNATSANDLAFSSDGTQLAVVTGDRLYILDGESLQPVEQIALDWVE